MTFIYAKNTSFLPPKRKEKHPIRYIIWKKMGLQQTGEVTLAVILGPAYHSYSNALANLNLQNLSDRRESLCLSFALKCEESSRYQHWFKENSTKNTRHSSIYKPVWTRTKRFENSPLPYLTHLLNKYYKITKQFYQYVKPLTCYQWMIRKVDRIGYLIKTP